MARAKAEIASYIDFLKEKYASTEASIKSEITKQWGEGHLYSEQQRESQEGEFQKLVEEIRASTLTPERMSTLVQHAPGTDEQVATSIRKQMGGVIAKYERMANVCNEGFCDFSFNAKSYVSKYSNIAKNAEAPNYERYLATAENGVDNVLDAVSDQYAKVVAGSGGGADVPPAKGGLLKALSDLKARFNSVAPATRSEQLARRAGLRAVQQGTRAAEKNDIEQAEASRRMAEALLDIALGVTPVVGFGRDVYEAVIGESLLNGEKLSESERLLAVLGVMTAGIGDEPYRISRALEAMSDSRTLNKQIFKVESQTAEEVNAMLKNRYKLTEPPYREGTRVYRYETIGEERYARVYAEGINGKEGAWVFRPEQVKGLDPNEIQGKFALPYTPTHVTEVVIPPRQIVERGAVNKKIFVGDEAVAYQYRLLDYSKAIFGEGKPLPVAP
ncbi:hypothetical protein N181_23310 [Sinorhizobium fredii USDA 205]|nr:hypothetical protein N181_23310 [Sinorhizobium fredii USDA 205]